MRRWVLGAIIALGVAICAIFTSHIVLAHLYGATQMEVYVQLDGQRGRVVPQTLEEVEQSNPVVLTYEDNENTADVAALNWSDLSWQQNVQIRSWENVAAGNLAVLNSPGAQMEPLRVTACGGLGKSDYLLTLEGVSLKPYEAVMGVTRAPLPLPKPAPSAQEAGVTEGIENAAGVSFSVYETKPINVLPIAASIGIAMGVAVFAVWMGYRRMWGDATSTLLEHGLQDMTVRDIEIVGHAMELKEFTVPELMKLTKESKLKVWRTVQRLVEQGLVQPTEQTRLAANGLGGRGKPSRVYRYVGRTSSR